MQNSPSNTCRFFLATAISFFRGVLGLSIEGRCCKSTCCHKRYGSSFPQTSIPYRFFEVPFSVLLRILIRGYRLLLSPLLQSSCRFEPSCAVYAEEAILSRGPFHGCWLTLRRLLRCHPWGGSGFDPVPMPPRLSPSASEIEALSIEYQATRTSTPVL